MQGHTIVCGDDALATRIAAELASAGADVVTLDGADGLTNADVNEAAAVVCAGPDDPENLEIALLARELSSEVRVVVRLANSVLREAVAVGNGGGAVIDVADVAAPSVVEACLARTTHTVRAAGVEFVISGTGAPRHATLRQIYGDLAPIAVVSGGNSPTPGEVIACPGLRSSGIRG